MVITDGPPQLTRISASALLRLIEHLVELQDQNDGLDNERVVAS